MLNFPKDLYADVRFEEVTETVLAYENGMLRQNKESSTAGAFLRVYDGKRWYYCATTALEQLQEELDALASMAQPNGDILNDPVVSRFQVNRDSILRFGYTDLRRVPNGEKRALVESYLPLLEEVAEISVSRARYEDKHTLRHFVSSLGADITYDYQHAGLLLGYTITAGDSPYNNSQRLYGQTFDEMKNQQEKLRAGIATDLDYAKNAVPVEPGIYTCVLSPVVAGVFAHESFGHKSEADFMLGSETMRR